MIPRKVIFKRRYAFTTSSLYIYDLWNEPIVAALCGRNQCSVLYFEILTGMASPFK